MQRLLRLVLIFAILAYFPAQLAYALYAITTDFRYLGPNEALAATVAPRATPGNLPLLTVRNADAALTAQIAHIIGSGDYPLADQRLDVAVSDRLPAGVEGVYDSITDRIYVRRSADLKRVIPHELGHLIDDRYANPADRSLYRSVRDLSPAIQWGGTRHSDDWRLLAGEDFAETFALLFWERPLFSQESLTDFQSIDNPTALKNFFLNLREN